MSDYQGNIIIKNPATPTGPSAYGSAPGMWKLNEVAYWIKQGVWPDANIVPDQYFPYVSLLLSTTSLGNANNNLFVDSSGAFNPVSRNGNTMQGSFTPYSTNWSNYFDGSGDYLSIPNNAALNMSGSTFTLECWIYPNGDYSDYRTIMSKRNASTTSYQMFLFQTTGYLSFSRANTAYQSSATPTANTWNHVAAVYDGTNINLYLNGTRVLQTAVSIADTTDPLLIGAIYTGGENFNGYISNARVLKGVQAYSGATYTVPTTPLTAISGTSLLTCQSNRFRDASTNNFTITVNGNTSVQDFGPFSPAYPGAVYNQSDITNWSGYFGGNGNYLTTTNTNFTGDATVECWLYVNSLANPFQIFGTNNGVSDGRWLGAFVVTNGAIVGGAAAGISSGYSSASGTIKIGQWQHIAWVKTSSGVFVYVNGTQVATCSLAQGYAYNATPLYIGRLDGNNAYCPNGYISNLRMVNGTALYTSTFTPPTTPLTAISGTTLLTLQNAAFTDNSTNNYVVTPFSNTTVTGNSPFNTVGYWSNYFTSSAYLSVPVTSSAFTLNADFTLEAWVYREPSGLTTLFDTRSGGNYSDWVVGVNSSGQVDFVTAGGAGVRITTTETVTANTWTHVACVRQGSTVKIYLNGVASVNTATYASTITPASTEGWIGRTKDPLNNAGYISNLRLVKGTAVYTANFTPPTAPLTAISGTSLLTCQNGRFIDNSTNAFTITPNNSPQVQSFNPFYTATIASNGGSMYFDGSGDYLALQNNPSYALGSGDFTLEVWVYPIVQGGHGSSNNDCIIDFRPGSNGAYGTLYIPSSGASVNWYANTANRITGAAIPNGAWSHLCVSRVSGSTRLFINGVQSGSTYADSTNYLQTNPWIGQFNDSVGSGWFQGYMSGMRIVKGSGVSSTFTPPTAPVNPTAATTLLLNGMNAGIYDATTINDMETVGNAQVSTVQSKYGGSSVYFDGSGDSGRIAVNQPALQFGTSNFTAEGWVYSTGGTGTYQHILTGGTSWTTGSGGIYWYYNGGSPTLGAAWNQIATNPAVNSGTLSINTWYHFALVRNGNTMTLYINGTSVSSISVTGVSLAFNNQSRTNIGGGGWDNDFAGYIDDLRVTNGIARYTSNFTPPTQAFPTY